MARKEYTLRIRVTKGYMEKLRNYASVKGTTVSEVIRAYIHRLPHAVQNEPLPLTDCTPKVELGINFQGSGDGI